MNGHRLAHIGLTVSDLDASLAFFTAFLGFALTSRLAPIDPGAISGITGVDGGVARELAYLAKDELVVELLEYSAPPPKRSPLGPSDPGYFHLFVEADDFDATLTAALPHGFSAVSPPYVIEAGPNAGKRGTYLRHGDGYALELIGR